MVGFRAYGICNRKDSGVKFSTQNRNMAQDSIKMLLYSLHAVFGVLVLTGASLGLGMWLCRNLPSTFSRLDRVALGFFGGFGVISCTLFLVGQISFTRRIVLVVLWAAIIANIKELVHFGLSISVRRTLKDAPKLPLLLITIILSMTAVTGLSEVTGDWNNDAVAYHLLGPKVWLRNGMIRPVADNCHTAFPQTAETMFAALSAVGGPRAPKFSSFVTLGMLLLISASLAIRAGLDNNEVWWVAAIVATMPAVYTGSNGCFIDGIYAAFVLAAIRVGADAVVNRDWAIFGLFCGLAMATKYTGLIAIPIITLLVAWMRSRGGFDDRKQSVSTLSAIICVTLAVAAPYYLRNWILLGCPIYPPPPGFAHICTPKYLSRDVIAQFHAYILHRGAGLGRGLAAFILLPYNLTYHTSNFHGAGGIGLAPLGLGPIGLVAARNNVYTRTLGFIGLLLVIAWFVTQQESRFLIPVYVLSAIVSVVGWQHVKALKNSSAVLLAMSLVAFSVAYGSYMIGRGWPDDALAVFSPTYAELSRKANIPLLPSFEYLNGRPEVKKVLILDRSVPPVYLDKDYIKPVGQWGELTLRGISSPLGALGMARELGVTHVLDVNSDVAPFQIINPTSALSLVLDERNQRIYKIN